MPGESSAVPTEDRVGLNHLQTSPPTGPESRQHNPQESVAAVEAQATRGVLLENRQLVTKREDLRLQGRTGSKTGGYQSEKSDEKRAHRGSHHDLTIDRNLFVFRSGEVFGNHRLNAVRLAGQLKLETAIPALIQSLLGRNQVPVWAYDKPGPVGASTFSRNARLENDIVARALADIGDPAVPAVAYVLANGDTRVLRVRAAWILININTPAARKAMSDALESARDT